MQDPEHQWMEQDICQDDLLHRSHPPSQSHSRSLSRTTTSAPGLCSGSPQSGEKHARPLEDDGEEQEEEEEHNRYHDPTPAVVHAQKLNSNNSRPKAADYDSSTQDTILAAASYYRVFLFTENAFPDPATEVEFLRRAWKHANEDSGLEHLLLDADIAKIVSFSYTFIDGTYTNSIFQIKARGSQACGEAKSKTQALVETLYTFDSGCGKSAIKKNRDKAEHLKHEKGFVYKVIKLFATYGTFLCSFCFRNLKTPMILRVIAGGCTSTPSFKKPSIACGSRTDVTKEYFSRPYSRACPFQQLHFF